MKKTLGVFASLLVFGSLAACSDDDKAPVQDDGRPVQAQDASPVASLVPSVPDLAERTPCEAADDLSGATIEGDVVQLLSGKLDSGEIASWALLETGAGEEWIAYEGGVVGDETQDSSVGVRVAKNDRLLVVDHGRGVDAKYGVLAPDLAGTVVLNADGSLTLTYGTIAAADADAWLALRASQEAAGETCEISWAE